jgi:hypothetical protein
MEHPHNREFEAVLKEVRWGMIARISFIRAYYDVVIQMRDQYAIPLLDNYDFWFRQLDDAERACQSSCHRMIGNRSTFRRVTADVKSTPTSRGVCVLQSAVAGRKRGVRTRHKSSASDGEGRTRDP